MKRMLFLLVLLLSMAASAMADPVRVRDFRAAIDVRTDGDIVVEERLRVEIPAGGTFHGIFRDVPVVTRWPESGRGEMEVISVTLDGRARPADDVRREAGVVRVYQRDRDVRLPAGLHDFVLVYRMSGQVGLFPENDELTWNVTGDGWEAPVDRASCVIRCPQDAPYYGQAAWLGRAGTKAGGPEVAMSRTVEDGRQVMRFQTRRPVMPGEHLTVAAGWKKGFVFPEPMGGMTTYLLASLAAFLSVYFYLVWRRFGKDPEKGVVIPRFHPPKTRRGQAGGVEGVMSPAAVGYLANGMLFYPRCLGAALLSLSGRGFCAVEGDARRGFTIRRTEGQSSCEDENAVLAAMPAFPLPVDKAHGEELYAMRKALYAQLGKDHRGLWRGKNGGGLLGGLFGSIWGFLGVVGGMLGLAAILGWHLGGSLPEELAGIPFLLLFLCFFVRHLARAAKAFWQRGKKVPFFMMTLFGGGMALAFGVGLVYAIAGDVLHWFSPVQIALIAAALLVPLGFTSIMDAPSVEARALLDEIEGLAMYIGTAETDRFNAMNPPDRTLEHYQELLPYAVALDLEDAWGARFSGVLDAHAEAREALLSPAMAGALSSDADQGAASYASDQASSESSFGGGGGGGAGSGGGGGGGGGC